MTEKIYYRFMHDGLMLPDEDLTEAQKVLVDEFGNAELCQGVICIDVPQSDMMTYLPDFKRCIEIGRKIQKDFAFTDFKLAFFNPPYFKKIPEYSSSDNSIKPEYEWEVVSGEWSARYSRLLGIINNGRYNEGKEDVLRSFTI